MSDDNFIARWSRLKREAESEKRGLEKSEPPKASREQQPEAAPGSESHPHTEPPFDPATLPPIESIVAGTDIRAFLQKGVPAELTKAALRRAWTTDPAIRDFIEIAENQWDFTDPSSIPGFGALQPGDDLRQLVGQAMGRLSDAPQPDALIDDRREETHQSATDLEKASQPPPAAAEAPDTPSEPDKAADQNTFALAAPQRPEVASEKRLAPKRKGHGAAIPR